jgi:outer membrane receptor protein involved in Fe transport
VLNLNRDVINKSGERNTEDLLKHQPIANSNSVPAQNNGTSQGGAAGTSSVSLRGFDNIATLVMVDGRRVAPFPGAGYVDLNTVPLTAVESIEVLKDGASATYGADAVAGVINIKLWKDYRGAQVTLDYGNTLDKDAGLYSGDVLFGTGDDKISINGDMFFYHHNSMFNRDRGNSSKPPFLSSNASPYNLQLNTAAIVEAGGTPATTTNTAGTEFGTAPDSTNGLSPASDFTYFHGRPRSAFSILPGFNFNQFSSSFPEQERWGGYVAFEDKICDDQLRFYGDFYYVDSLTHDELAPGATNDFITKGQGTIAIPPRENNNGVEPFANTPSYGATGMPANAFNPFNPFNQIISVGTRARLADFGNRLIDNENFAYLATLGVRGDKLFDGSWGYDAGARYSEIYDISQIQDVNVIRFNRVMNANDTIFDPNSAQFIGTTVPYNPFGSFKRPPASNGPTLAYATLYRRDLNISKEFTLDANVYTTDLFDLPAGGVGLAFGAQWRRESIFFNPDDQGRLKEEAGVGQSFRVQAGRKDYAFYAETRIPLFSPEMGIWGLHSVEFSASGRFEDFRSNNTNVLVPKVELRWQPFDEQLTIRSTWSEGFIEPTLSELYGAPIFTLAPTNLTSFGGTSEPETTEEVDPNKNLQPEDSRAWTGGAVYTPKFVQNMMPGVTLTLHLDLWDIERTGVVVVPSAQNVISRCKPDLNNGGLCTSGLNPGEEVDIDTAGGTVTFVKTTFLNGGRENARGADMGFQLQYQNDKFGTFTWWTEATYLDSFIFQANTALHTNLLGRTDNPGRELSGRANNDPFEGAFFGQVTGGDGWAKWKGTSRIDWQWKNFDLNWSCRYLDGWRELINNSAGLAGTHLGTGDVLTTPAHQHYVHGTWMFDTQASYTLVFTPPVESQPVAGYSKGGKEVMTDNKGKQIESTAAYAMPCWQVLFNNTTFTVGCNNVFGQDPPPEFGFGRGNSTSYPGFNYDNLGRFVYFELKKKF